MQRTRWNSLDGIAIVEMAALLFRICGKANHMVTLRLKPRGIRWRAMKRSTERILTTHTGSLPRPDNLVQLMVAREQGKAVDTIELADTVRKAVADVVKHQAAVGIDIISDGEMSKIGFANYVKDRLTGFEGESNPVVAQDVLDFPDLRGRMFRRNEGSESRYFTPACTGPITLRDKEAVQIDIENLKAAVQEFQPTEVFMPAASPGT